MSENPFDGSPISRRQFVRLSAATGGALALPGAASAEVSSAAFDAEYEYVLNHTPEEYEVPTLVEFSDTASMGTMESIASDVRTTTSPEPAAYAQLSTTQAEEVAALPTAETIHFSPGANPFWRLGYYPLGVFPEPERSVDFLDYEEVAAGFDHLADEHDDRMRVFSVGESAGKYNYVSDRPDPRDVLFVEVTNDVEDREAFAEKKGVLVNCTIHGNERAGGEAATRFIEQVLRGEYPEVDTLLDDIALIFAFTNPDGWAARRPQYASNGVPGAPLHERGNAGGDTNRQFPNPGWVSAAHTIAEPLGATLDGETPAPDYVVDTTPDMLAFVDHCRSYENLECGIDLHGMLSSKDFVLALDGASQSSTSELQNSFELIEAIDERVTENLPEWEQLGQALSPITEQANPSVSTLSVLPEQAFNYGTPVETIGYSGTGFVDEWMAFPEELGGLGIPSLTMEMAYSNTVGGNVFDPVRVGMQADGYRGSILGAIDYATRDVEGRFEGSGDVAYVTTDELTASAEDLPYVGGEDSEAVTYDPSGDATTTETTVPSAGTTAVAYTVEDDIGSLAVHPHVHESVASARLLDPDGEVVREFDAEDGRALGGACCGLPTWEVSDPAAGEWTLELTNVLPTESNAEARFVTARGAGEAPDPRKELGYAQRDYEVTPLRYFEDLDEDADVDVDAYAPEDLNPGRLKGYDHLVVIHDDTGNKPQKYRNAIQRFVDDGGNLVLTDEGLNLLADLDVGLGAGDITQQTAYVGQLDDVNDDHPLVTDRRPIQDHLWYIAPVGYSEDEAPIYGLDNAAFESSGGTVAGTTGGDVVVGTIDAGSEAGEIQVIGSLLPPAWQGNLHPFGMTDYAATYFGHLVMTNALRGQQVREVDGEETLRIGRGDE
ncbi:hypothetical protein HWV23_06005 [Natronomonas halophila]|uniref:M14 family metallopeptidase n=1 Tax=Natronomonas halophila TaxID=2747817 RepID=UPI0015B542A8|nr:M14 family metallopeptidase [Natronomonas halophila]QLD85298.1 hypothetical protein HWV23_06005 [Natronomonas halophila]